MHHKTGRFTGVMPFVLQLYKVSVNALITQAFYFIVPHFEFRALFSLRFPFAGLSVLALLLLFSVSETNAQVLNVESYRSEADTAGSWSGSLQFGFSAAKQKSETIQLNNRSSASYFGSRDTYLFITNLNLLRIDDELISNGYVHLRSTFFYQSRWSPEAFTQYQYSQDWGLRRRNLLGGGIRYDFVESDDFTAGFTTGGMYEHEVWRAEDGPRQQFDRFKSTSSLLMRGNLSSNTTLYVVGYYQAEPTDFLNPRLTGNIDLRFRITRIVQFAAQFSTTYDYAPALEVPSWIYSFQNSIVISL